MIPVMRIDTGICRAILLAAVCATVGFQPSAAWSGNLSGSVEKSRDSFNRQVESYEAKLRAKAEARRRAAQQRSLVTPSVSGSSTQSSDTVSSQTNQPVANTAMVKSITQTGNNSGNPIYRVNCNSGREKYVMRKDAKWMDNLGYSLSNRTWSLSLEDLAKTICQ